VAALTSCANKGGDKAANTRTKLKKYPYENVHIVYEVKGAGEGTEETFIADYGRLEAMYTDYIMASPQGPMPRRQLLLTKAADFYVADLAKNQGKHLLVKSFDSLYKLKENIPSPEDMKNRMLDLGQYQLVGKEVVNGLLCERWQQAVGPVTLFLYNNLLLKKINEGERGDYTEEIAVQIDTNWKYDSTKFILPELNYQEVLSPIRGL
jgi:hypothetical protein